ncbi:hypothetical protein BRC86_10680 [Halobacteriales archaeon QS_3_64_16]|nr:MAG: hypothetical protein BRC86_10680 [Halobacteriales archaeon QS_3_64_16]
MVKGTVSFFNQQGSYGFITVEEDNEEEGEDNSDGDGDDDDVFFHMADLTGPDLQEGQEVEFEIEQSEKGPRANNLTRLGDAAVDEEAAEERRLREDGVIVDEDGTHWVSINDM